METTIKRLMDALAVWGSDEIADEFTAEKALISAAQEVIGAVPGIIGVYEATSTMGSIYLDAVYVCDGEEESMCVRLSNHKAKPNSHIPPVWSFEPNDSEKSVRMGLATIERKAAQ